MSLTDSSFRTVLVINSLCRGAYLGWGYLYGFASFFVDMVSRATLAGGSQPSLIRNISRYLCRNFPRRWNPWSETPLSFALDRIFPKASSVASLDSCNKPVARQSCSYMGPHRAIHPIVLGTSLLPILCGYFPDLLRPCYRWTSRCPNGDSGDLTQLPSVMGALKVLRPCRSPRWGIWPRECGQEFLIQVVKVWPI